MANLSTFAASAGSVYGSLKSTSTLSSPFNLSTTLSNPGKLIFCNIVLGTFVVSYTITLNINGVSTTYSWTNTDSFTFPFPVYELGLQNGHCVYLNLEYTTCTITTINSNTKIYYMDKI